MIIPPVEYQVVEGVESQLYANHLSHFIFTNRILSRIRAAVTPEYSPRIVNIGSLTHAWTGFQFEDYNFNDGAEYDGLKGYAQAKTANIMFSVGLAHKLASENILSYSVHTGCELLILSYSTVSF